MLPALIAAAVSTIASLGSKAFKDAEAARRENAEKELYRRQAASDVLERRAAQSGVDTSRSQMADHDQQFLQQLANGRRDSSGDFVPLVSTLGNLGASIASEAGKTPSVDASTTNFQGYTGSDSAPITGATSLDDYDPEKEKFLRGLASRGMTA